MPVLPFLLNKYVIGAVIAVFVVSGAYIKGRSDHAAKVERAMIKAVTEQLKERGAIDQDVSSTDIRDICIELGGVPEDCDQ